MTEKKRAPRRSRLQTLAGVVSAVAAFMAPAAGLDWRAQCVFAGVAAVTFGDAYRIFRRARRARPGEGR